MAVDVQPHVDHRLDIQGLRGVAVIAVLLFHSFERLFPLGYLGVDIFFVISGYLMFAILKPQKLTIASIADFYFRRFRRIVPLYLAMILFVLVAALLFVHSFDHGQLKDETLPSIFYFSNCPVFHGTSYFELRTKYYFFQHTWSLSTELQFYVVVPLIIVVVQLLSHSPPFFNFLFVFYLAAVSFYRQTFVYATVNAKHMAPDGRVWQFCAGFLACMLREVGAFDCLRSSPADSSKKKIVKHIVGSVLPSVLLVGFLLSPIAVWSPPVLRVTAVLLAVSILTQPSASETDWKLAPLTWSPLVRIGDFSYSLYLVHWPLLIFHRYAFPEAYSMQLGLGMTTDGPTAVALFLVCFPIAFVVEEAAKRAMKRVRTWRSLVLIGAEFYVCFLAVLVVLARAPQHLMNATPVSQREYDKRAEQAFEMFRHPPESLPFVAAYRLNRDWNVYPQYALTWPAEVPSWTLAKPPGAFQVSRQVGTGKKNIVVVGNSHAGHAFIGLQHFFADEYANLTLFATAGCILGPSEWLIQSAAKRCDDFVNGALLDTLEKWEHPIDVLFVFFAFHGSAFDSYTDAENIKDTAVFLHMQSFYDAFGRIARDVVVGPYINLHLPSNPFFTGQKRLHDRRSPGRLGTSRTEQTAYYSVIRKYLRALKCPKCLPVDTSDLWCEGKDEKALCPVFDRNNLAYFVDEHHPSLLAVFIQGRWLRRLYDEHLARGNRTHPFFL